MDEYESKIERNRTVIHYNYDRFGRLTQETRVRLEPEVEEEPDKPSQYAGVVGWTMVDHADVETYLAQKYEILQHWQKGALVVRREIDEV